MAWADLVASDRVGPGQARRVDLAGAALCVVNCGGAFHVIDDTCTHEAYSLSEGEVWEEECEIECPKHASAFDLESGRPTCLPATRPVRVYPARVEGGIVQADLGEPT
jgi:3-phenylpropionate/trans-cinnamate dioxygenase ferredoxin subunit